MDQCLYYIFWYSVCNVSYFLIFQVSYEPGYCENLSSSLYNNLFMVNHFLKFSYYDTYLRIYTPEINLSQRRRWLQLNGSGSTSQKSSSAGGGTRVSAIMPPFLKPLTPDQQPPKSMHYSWDYAQNVSLPSSYDQVGPSYFSILRKCHIFGICCEAFLNR